MDERQPVMARLAARSRCSNFLTSAALIKGNHWGENELKSFEQKKRLLWYADLQHNALRRRKNVEWWS